MSSDNPHDNLTAAYAGRTAIIRIQGRASFKISPPLKQFIQRLIESKSVNRILINMAGCTGMDSTFMGVLAGLSYHIRDASGSTLKLINLSEKNRKLLTTLGVERVVNYSLSCNDEEKKLLTATGGDVECLAGDAPELIDTARTSLEAHEDLVKINPENRAKFKSVIELLQDDVRKFDRD
jgi:anti-anti-sigma factor